MSIVKIENVRVLDPIKKTDSIETVYLENGKLVEFGVCSAHTDPMKMETLEV